MTFAKFALSVPCLSIALYAQSETGVLTGKILTSQHLPASNSKILIQKQGKQITTVFADANGTYRFTLPGGDYTLRIESISKPISIVANQATSVNIELPPNTEQPQFFDSPEFTVAGVTDNTYRGGHGSDNILRSSETLTKETASLSQPTAAETSDEPFHLRAELDERSGHPLEAVREFQKAAELNPSERNLFDWGTELLSHRAPKGAAEVYAKGNHLYPQSVRMLLGLATSWYSAGAFEQSQRYFFQAIDINPSDPNPYTFLNKVQSREIVQSAGYRERFARFIKLQPENALANYYYGVSIWEQNHSPNAGEFFSKAVKLDPHLVPAYLQLGVTYSETGQYSNAIKAYQTCIREDPNLEEAHYRLSEAYRHIGESARAAEESAIYHKLSQQSAAEIERQRRDIQQFVIALKKTSQ
jgi:tetratricopeptide (TPR) repeat protein